MFQEPIHFVDNHIYAYLVVDAESLKVLDGNLLARIYYKGTGVYSDLEEMFLPKIDRAYLDQVKALLDGQEPVILEKVQSYTSDNETFSCRIEICKVSETQILLLIRELDTYENSKIEELVKLKDNPVFVLADDDHLTVAYGNTRFYRSVSRKKRLASEEKSLFFLHLLPESKRESFLNKVREEIGYFGECDIDLDLTFDGEYFQMFHFNAYQSVFDNRLYGVLISVRKQSDLIKKIEYDQQYFDIMQKFSKDLLFRIDIKHNTLVHRGDISKLVGLQPEIRNFPESMRKTGLIHPDDLEDYIAFVKKLMAGEETSYEPRFQFLNGTYEKYRLQASPLFDEQGNTVEVVGKCENIQKYVEIEAKAHYDALTTTLNKQSFRELVEDMIKRAVDTDKFAILFLDLDDFKGVNDTMGHIFGDFLLETVGKRITNSIRQQDRVGRVGGDEFVVFFQYAPSHQAVMERAEAILYSLRREFNNEGKTYSIKGSLGVALFPEHGKTYQELYDKADKALYQSKALGKDVITIYSPELEKG